MNLNELKELVDLDWKKVINDFRNLYENINECGIDNLHEKTMNIYVDVDYCNFLKVDEDDTEYIEVPNDVDKIAYNISKMVYDYEYPEDTSPSYHAFMYLPKELANSIGLDDIIICNYKEYEFGYKSSNYMYMGFNNSLTIDLYNCNDLINDIEDFYEFAIVELYNFKRDITYVINGIYEDKMKEMEEFKNKIKEIGASLFIGSTLIN